MGGEDYANSAAQAYPVTDSATTQLLTTAHTLSGTATGTWLVPNGSYYAFAWLTAAGSTDEGTLVLQGAPADAFYGSQMNGAVWSLLGPYEVEVTDRALGLSVESGSPHLAGLKLYRKPAP